MTIVKHPTLGDIDPATRGFWSGSRRFAGREVTVDLTIGGAGITLVLLRQLLAAIDDLVELDRSARQAMLRDANSPDPDGATRMYARIYLDELDDEELDAIFGTEDRARLDQHDVLAKLQLARVALYPEQGAGRMLLDYSLGDGSEYSHGVDVSSYLICVAFDESGRVCSVELDS